MSQPAGLSKAQQPSASPSPVQPVGSSPGGPLLVDVAASRHMIPVGVEEASHDDNAPLTPAQIAEIHEDIKDCKSTNVKRAGIENAPYDDDAPLPPSQIAVSYEDIKSGVIKNEHQSGHELTSNLDDTKKPSSTTASQRTTLVTQTDIQRPSTESCPPRTVQIQIDASDRINTSTATRSDSYEQSLPVSGGQMRTVNRPPPPSMIVDRNIDPSVHSLPLLEATLVEDQQENHESLEEGTVYDAIAVHTQDDGWRRHRKYIVVGLASLVFGGMATAIGIFVSLRNEKNEQDSSVLPTQLYHVDRVNKRCVTDQGLNSDLRQALFETVHECCGAEWPYDYNDCIQNSMSIIDMDNLTETKTTTSYPTPSHTSGETTSPSTTPSIGWSPTTSINIEQSISSNTTSMWRQQGQPIIGAASGDQAGWSVALSSDSKTLAVGSPYSGFGSGCVRVYHRKGAGSSWEQFSSDIENEKEDYSVFGYNVALSADSKTLAIGATTGRNSNGASSGHVKVYHRKGDDLSWKQLGQNIGGNKYVDSFGSSLSLSSDGNILAIGAPGHANSDDRPGYVNVYYWEDEQENWELVQSINGEVNGDLFGWSLSLSAESKTLAIGAPYNGGNGGTSGHVRVYHVKDEESIWRNLGSGVVEDGSSWTQLGEDIEGESVGDQSGASVALSADGKTLAIGANAHDMVSGQVKIYYFNSGSDSDNSTAASSSWKQLGQDIDGEDVGDMAGRSVSLSSDGKTLAIGAPKPDHADMPGYVKVYHKVDEGSSWEQLGQNIYGIQADDWTGFSVSLSANGKTLAIGSPENDGNGDISGLARVFNIDL